MLRNDSVGKLSALESSTLLELQEFSTNISSEEEYEDISLYLQVE